MAKWFILLLAAPLFSSPATIDLSHPSSRVKAHLDALPPLSYYGFNHAPEIAQFIQSLQCDYQIAAAVETGTYLGETTRYLSSCFPEVHTIEISNDYYLNAQSSFQDYPNIHAHHGSSETVLQGILPSLTTQRVIFYLDAHWNEHWPLLNELKEIGKTHKDNCIIVIDDFKVSGRKDISFDRYGPHSCSYKYIRSALDQIYTSCDCYYLIPKNLSSRAKFIAIPRKWQTERDRICRTSFDLASRFLKSLKEREISSK